MSLKDIDIKDEYRSLLDNVVQDFYLPVLGQSILYKRAVGFFSSTSLVELSKGICKLVQNGGTIQLIASPKLSAEDLLAIESGFDRRYEVIENSLLRQLNEQTGPFAEERLNLLSNLIAVGKLEIRIAFLESENEIGMFHEKVGLMYDADSNIIAFSGSMNESFNAFYRNYESIDIFTSWSGEEQRVLNKQAAFNALWGDYEPHVKVINFPRIEKELLLRYRRDEQIDLSIDEREYSRESAKFTPPGSGQIPKKHNARPYIPDNVHIRPYQQDAIDTWVSHKYIGIFDMATGTGKTYTALAAISQLYSDMEENLAVIIVCPYQHLVEQWREDIELFGMKPIICYSASTQRDWKKRLQNSITGFNLGVLQHFCMVSTNATFSSNFVQSQLLLLNGKILLVVDEAHNFGAEHLSTMLLPHVPYRLALSATIDRHGDEDGTQRLYDYFGEKCIEYTLKEAVDNNMLTPYYYYPVVISLNTDELDQYLELTKLIRKNVHSDEYGKLALSEYAKMLLIKRARLVASASEKLNALVSAIEKYKRDSHILVYCGAATMRDADYKENAPPIDEIRQIDAVADLLGNELEMRISKFTSEESAEEREIIKSNFADGRHLQALVAIRCLDEGVNIPSIKTAFILASSTNPKEYVQRRGRVLRKYAGKQFAIIYDFITLPVPTTEVDNYSADVIQSVQSLAVREITRMRDFASISENPSAVDSLVSEIIHAYGITPEIEGGNTDV